MWKTNWVIDAVDSALKMIREKYFLFRVKKHKIGGRERERFHCGVGYGF